MEIKDLKCPKCHESLTHVVKVSVVEMHEETHIDKEGNAFELSTNEIDQSGIKYMCPHLACEHKEDSIDAFMTTTDVDEEHFGEEVEVITVNGWQYEIDEETGVIVDNYSAEENL